MGATAAQKWTCYYMRFGSSVIPALNRPWCHKCRLLSPLQPKLLITPSYMYRTKFVHREHRGGHSVSPIGSFKDNLSKETRAVVTTKEWNDKQCKNQGSVQSGSGGSLSSEKTNSKCLTQQDVLLCYSQEIDWQITRSGHACMHWPTGTHTHTHTHA
jgi:hypothetical protein